MKHEGEGHTADWLVKVNCLSHLQLPSKAATCQKGHMIRHGSLNKVHSVVLLQSGQTLAPHKRSIIPHTFSPRGVAAFLQTANLGAVVGFPYSEIPNLIFLRCPAQQAMPAFVQVANPEALYCSSQIQSQQHYRPIGSSKASSTIVFFNHPIQEAL